MALRWSDLDFESGVLQVRQNLARMPVVGYVEREPKTKSGRRKIVLAAFD